MSSEIPENEDDIENLRREYENARQRLSQQAAVFQSFAENGYEMLRITLVFTGLLISLTGAFGTSYAEQILASQACAVHLGIGCLFTVGIVTKGGLVFLMGGTALYAMGQGREARGIGTGCGPNDIDSVLYKCQSEQNFLRSRLKTYRERISDNNEVIRFMEGLLAYGGVCLLLTIGLFAIAIYSNTTGSPIGPEITIGSVAALFIIYWYMEKRLPDRYLEAETPNWMLGILFAQSSNEDIQDKPE